MRAAVIVMQAVQAVAAGGRAVMVGAFRVLGVVGCVFFVGWAGAKRPCIGGVPLRPLQIVGYVSEGTHSGDGGLCMESTHIQRNGFWVHDMRC